MAHKHKSNRNANNNDRRKVGGGGGGSVTAGKKPSDDDDDDAMDKQKKNLLYESSGRLFTIMYIVSFYLDVSEDWKQDNIWYKQILLSFYVLYIFSSGCSLQSYTCLLVAVNIMMMKYSFPDLANHLNFALILNTFQVTTLLYLWLCNNYCRHRGNNNKDDDNDDNQISTISSSSTFFPSYGQYFQFIRPWMAIFVFMTYFFAGFHKLNWDYLNTDVSCTRNFLNRILKHWGLLERNIQFSSGFVYWSSIVTLVWEIVGPFMIFIPQTQPYMMVYSLLMHMVFATIGFTDFTSMMCSLWFVLLPDEYLRIIVINNNNNNNNSIISSERIRRWMYTMFPFFVLTCTILYNPENKNRTIVFRLGLCFIVAISILMWPILAKLLVNYRTIPKWEQSYEWSFRPWFLWFFPLFMSFYGMNNYLGLRTAGNFSMFSNIRTEGPTSNHLLLGNNQLKLFHYQDDVIKTANGGMVLPLVEFQRRILKMKREREQQMAVGDNNNNNKIQPFAVDVIFKGELIESDDVVTDPRWEFQPSWEHYWLHFRMVQSDDKPNKCRW